MGFSKYFKWKLCAELRPHPPSSIFVEMENPTSLSYNEALARQNRPRKHKSRMRIFNVITDIAEGETVQFTVTARSINAAFNRAARRVGQGRQIVVQDSDRVLSGTVPVEP
jgi:hypothetical protein